MIPLLTTPGLLTVAGFGTTLFTATFSEAVSLCDTGASVDVTVLLSFGLSGTREELWYY